MSARRVVATAAAVAVLSLGAGWYSVQAFPMRERTGRRRNREDQGAARTARTAGEAGDGRKSRSAPQLSGAARRSVRERSGLVGGRQDQADAGRRRPGGRIPPRGRDDAPEQRSARPRRQPVDDAGPHRVGGKRPGTIRTPGRGPADRDARVRGGPLGRAMAVRGPVPSADVVRGRRHVRDAAAATASTARATSPDLDAAAATTAAGDQLAAGSNRHAAASAPGTGKRAPRDRRRPRRLRRRARQAPALTFRIRRSPKARLRVGGEIKPPTKIRNVNPVYPPDAMEQKVQGVVILEARIEPDGTVSRTRVLRSIPMLDDAAKEAVGQWKFTPTLLNGQAIPLVMTVTVNFTLQYSTAVKAQAPSSNALPTANSKPTPNGSWLGSESLMDLEVGTALGFGTWSSGFTLLPALARPHARQLDDHLHRLLHVLHRHPLQPGVEVVLAGEEVRRRQAHERQP